MLVGNLWTRSEGQLNRLVGTLMWSKGQLNWLVGTLMWSKGQLNRLVGTLMWSTSTKVMAVMRNTGTGRLTKGVTALQKGRVTVRILFGFGFG